MDNKEKALNKIDEIGRIVVQLHISLLNRKYKYIENDFKNIGEALAEVKDIIKNMQYVMKIL